MPAETLNSGHDPAKDEMKFPYPFTGEANAEVRVPHARMVHGEAFVKARIEGWFKSHDRPRPGESVLIPDYQLDPSLFQPQSGKI